MNWFAEHMAESLVVLGLALLVIEILILGFATFILLFVGIAAIITGALIYLAVIPDTLLSALLSMGIWTALAAILLWRPLRNMQKDVDPTRASNDLIGYRFTLESDVSDKERPEYRFSGIMWRIKATEPLQAGTEVEVIHTDVGQLTVRAVNQ